MRRDVFVCHAVEDAAEADEVVGALRRAGLSCSSAQREGMQEPAAALIPHGFGSSRIVLLLFSRHARASPQVHREVEHAVNLGRPILPLRLDAAAWSEAMEYYLAGVPALEAVPGPLRRHFPILIESIGHALAAEMESVPAGSEVLPPSLREAGRFGFVGRERECAALRSAWQTAREGGRKLVLVTGESGIGKSSLIADLARAVHAEGATVLLGRCDPDLGIPFEPFVEALESYVAAADPRVLTRQVGALGELAEELVRLAPRLVGRLPDLAGPPGRQVDRYRLFEAVAEFAVQIAARQATLLLLEDLHWAGAPTLLLLRHLIRAPSLSRFMVVATSRSEEAGPGGSLAETFAELEREVGAVHLVLEGLEVNAVSAMVAASGPVSGRGGTASAQLADQIRGETSGNPFFVGELLTHLSETHADLRERGDLVETLLADGLPSGVGEVMRQRLSRLEEGGRRALSAAAIVGSEFSLELVLELCGDQELVLDGLEEAERAHLVRSAGRPGVYTFPHALVRTFLLDSLGRYGRARLHRDVGRLLEQWPDAHERSAELAHHFGEAVLVGEVDQAVRYARQAGDRARERLAFEEAALFYRKALTALELREAIDLALRCDLRTALCEQLARAGDPQHRDWVFAAADDARTLDDPVRLASAVAAAFGINRYGEIGVVDREAVALVEEALERLGPGDHPLRARLLVGLSLLLDFGPESDRMGQLWREAAAMARRLDDVDTSAFVLMRSQQNAVSPELGSELLRSGNELVALGGRLSSPEYALSGQILLWHGSLRAADLDRGRQALDAAVRLEPGVRQPNHSYSLAICLAARALVESRFDEVEALVTRELEIGRSAGVPDSRLNGVAGGQLAWLRAERGRWGEIEGLLRGLNESHPGIASWQIALALLYIETDRPAEAHDLFEPLAANAFRGLPRDATELSNLFLLGLIAAGLRHPAAERLYDLLQPYGGQIAAAPVGAHGPVELALGALAAGRASRERRVANRLRGFAQAERHFAASAAQGEHMPAPSFLARTRIYWAVMRRTRDLPDDRDRARELARQALAAADKLGLERIRELAGRVVAS